MNHIGFYQDSYRGQIVYRCLHCQYDTFRDDAMPYHMRSHAVVRLPETDLSTADWYDLQKRVRLGVGHKIGLGFLTWNTADASFLGVKALDLEKTFLKSIGIGAQIYWCDNGSTDSTVRDIARMFQDSPIVATTFRENLGQSVARNEIIQNALHDGCDYVLFVDGDVEIVRYSSYAMLRRFLERPDDTKWLGCIGMFCRNCTHERDPQVADECRYISENMIDSDPPIAWTNYGLFPRRVLETCKFDESGPFYGPGWGFEDDDYYLQMVVAGFTSFNTKYFRHMHRRRHSSVKNIGVSPAAGVHAERKKYLLAKWGGFDHPVIQRHIRMIENQTMPVLEY